MAELLACRLGPRLAFVWITKLDKGSGAVCAFPVRPAFINGASEAGKSSSRGAYDSMSARIFSQAPAPLSCVARNSPVEISRKAAPTVSPALQTAPRKTASRDLEQLRIDGRARSYDSDYFAAHQFFGF